MNRAVMVAPFADEELLTFSGRGGKTMTYIEDETVMDRLDAGYGYGNWQIQVDEARAEGVVKVRLGVRENGEWCWFEDFGYANREGGETLKEAVTDGIRRCGRMVGIARDLYRKSTYEPGGKLGPRPPAPRGSPEGVHDPSSLVGVIEEAKDSPDFMPHVDPVEGFVLTFKLKGEGRQGGIKVIATGLVAEQLADVGKAAIGMRVSCWGRVKDESFTNKGGRTITYQVLELERITGPFGALPEDKPDPVAEGQVPAFDLSDEALAAIAPRGGVDSDLADT